LVVVWLTVVGGLFVGCSGGCSEAA
jgi:hypothetical protein